MYINAKFVLRVSLTTDLCSNICLYIQEGLHVISVMLSSHDAHIYIDIYALFTKSHPPRPKSKPY